MPSRRTLPCPRPAAPAAAFRFIGLAVLAALSLCVPATLRAAEPVPLIPRQLLFGLPERADVSISPDGTRLSFLAPVDGVMNIWQAPADNIAAARPLTREKRRAITNHFWTYDNKYLLFYRDTDGDEDYHVLRADAATGEVKDLTPIDGVDADIIAASPKFPGEILVGINDRDPKYNDIYRVNIATGERTRVLKNTAFAIVFADDDYKLRLGRTDNGWEKMKDAASRPWSVRPAGTYLSPKGSLVTRSLPFFDESSDYIYLFTQDGWDLTALVRFRFGKDEQKTIAAGEQADIAGAIVNPVTKAVEAVWEEHAARRWQAIDPAVWDDLKALQGLDPGAFHVTGQTADGRKWIVAYDRDTGPVAWYLYDRDTRKGTFLCRSQPELDKMPLARMHALSIPARDGLDLVSYLTLPVGTDDDGNGRPDKPLPLILWVHGGPASRDTWGFSPVHQFLANRGYAVLSVNYRGSDGFGKSFQEAGNRQWGGRMQGDLIDAVDWAVKEGIADAAKLAIGGASYGGYAALVGMTFTPERFVCGIDFCGPSNLYTMFLSDRAGFFKIDMEDFKREVGDPKSKKGREFLLSRSPLTKADQLKRPLLVAQGANDPRVDKQESDQFVEAVKDKTVPVTYLVYPDEGHGFDQPANEIAFYAAVEIFLARHLGGRSEPFGDDLKGSSVKLEMGAEHIPGLPEALAARSAGEAPAGKGAAEKAEVPPVPPPAP